MTTSARSPLYEAQHSNRYERQQLIREYEKSHNCRLIVAIGAIDADSIAPFEETLYDASPGEDLHLLLATLGGDGETALRMAHQAQSRCRELSIIIPDQAKSAGTILTLGAHHIFMGPTSDLGPIDPQVRLNNGSYVAAKTIIAAVEHAEQRIQQMPESFPLYISLLEGITADIVQSARNHIARTGDQLKEALESVTGRDQSRIENLAKKLKGPLISNKPSHGASISSKQAKAMGLPVIEVDSSSCQWRAIWRLWTKYVALKPSSIYSSMRMYEGRQASYVLEFQQ